MVSSMARIVKELCLSLTILLIINDNGGPRGVPQQGELGVTELYVQGLRALKHRVVHYRHLTHLGVLVTLKLNLRIDEIEGGR